MRKSFAALGITDTAHVDVWTALLSGLAAQQLANDPGGHRWVDLTGPVVDMFVGFALKEEP